jgi:hypothetical protein
MHPMIVMALASEAERERKREQPKLQRRSLTRAERSAGSDDARSPSGFARLLAAGLSLAIRPS